MRYYAQLYVTNALGPERLPVPGCGVDAIYPLDGRLSYENMVNQLVTHIKTKWEYGQRNYVGGQIMRGSFSDPTPLGPVHYVK